jgi:acylpyruvate hydrolase
MRLVTVEGSSGSVAAVERSDGRYAVKAKDGRTYRDVGELLQSGPDWRADATRAKERVPDAWPLLRPILEPGAIVCVGLNYRKHVLEMGRVLPTVPTFFAKLPRALTDPHATIAMPDASPSVDYEGELTIVIGKGGRDLATADAWGAVAGLTLLNDVSMRDFQKRSLQWFAGKSWQGCTPSGPAMVTPDDLPQFETREIITRVNGEVRQRSPMSDLIFDVPCLVADLSRIIELRPGDLIATGTPGGVGDAMTPPNYLKHGDVVEITFEGIGQLRNSFERKP